MADDIKIKIGGDSSGAENAAKKAEKSAKQSAEEIKKGFSAAGGAAGEMGNKLMEAAGSPMTMLTAGVLAVTAQIVKMFDIFNKQMQATAALARQEANFLKNSGAIDEAREKQFKSWYESQLKKIESEYDAKATAAKDAGIFDDQYRRALMAEQTRKENLLEKEALNILYENFGIDAETATGGIYTLTKNRKRDNANQIKLETFQVAQELEWMMGNTSLSKAIANTVGGKQGTDFDRNGDAEYLADYLNKMISSPASLRDAIGADDRQALLELRQRVNDLRIRQKQLETEDLNLPDTLESAGDTQIYNARLRAEADAATARKNAPLEAEKAKAAAAKAEADAAEKRAADAEKKQKAEALAATARYSNELQQLQQEFIHNRIRAEQGDLAAELRKAKMEFREEFNAIYNNGTKEDTAMLDAVLKARLDKIRSAFAAPSAELPVISREFSTDALTRVGGYLGRSVRSTSEMLLEKQVNYQKQIAENTLKTANKKRTF